MTPDLVGELQRQVRLLEDDLRGRVTTQPAVLSAWQAEHRGALDRGRTAAVWEAWRDDRVTQAAVAWVLTTVFVKFCEDNALVAPVWIGQGYRLQEALDAQRKYFRSHNEDTDREWLGQAVAYLASLPATRALVDEHSPLHAVSPSGDAATALLNFWRERGEDGRALRDLTVLELSTRFLGDLYQDLSQHAKDTYALLQTPEFVEEFILDRTLEPALAERSLNGFRLIDPTCGSGHFLLGAFARLLDRWHRHAPGLETQARVQAALDAIHGVDLNPFAVAIARFRLTIAALCACGLHRLEDAPAFSYHLACGDSLLHGSDQHAIDYGPGYDVDADAAGFAYSSEDLRVLRQILQPGRYDVVVGNPPYITVKDRALNRLYRARYKTCKGTYALTVPFIERFFGLAIPSGSDRPTGWVGQITSNSFMKREFGAPLIENFLSFRDLRLVVNTSGAYIPGHGTPTVIIVGRSQSPVDDTVRAVLGIRGEVGTPTDASKGQVWRSIVDHVNEPGHDDGWTSTADLDRDLLARHPWSLTGGGAVQLAERVRAERRRLSECVASIGRTTATGEDDVFFTTLARVRALGLTHYTRRAVVGDTVRDFSISDEPLLWWPYGDNTASNELSKDSVVVSRVLWAAKVSLQSRIIFNKTLSERGRPWFDHLECYRSKLGCHRGIGFSFVSTHNNFAFDRQGRLFNRTAPVIKLPERATEDEHLELLGVLNSSTACFWLKQNSHDKG
ncbi:MAG: BREX-2 system adenine-specific DNA-methyltransferase PglX, partial [Pseudonocardiaceae bacterium]